MNLEALNNKLLAAARLDCPSNQVPYAFEKRVMAHLKSAPTATELLWWGRALWYGAATCAAIALLMGAWSISPGGRASDSLTYDLEQTVLASVNEAANNW